MEEVDLSHISLNEELARELKTTIDAQYEEVLESDYCSEARAQGSANWVEQFFTTNGHLALVLFAIVVLLLLTPWALKRLEPGTWTKVLAYALPMLVFVGVLAHTVIQTVEMRDTLLEDAADCEPLTASEGDTELALATQKQGVIRSLRSKLMAAHDRRDAFLESVSGQPTPTP